MLIRAFLQCGKIPQTSKVKMISLKARRVWQHVSECVNVMSQDGWYRQQLYIRDVGHHCVLREFTLSWTHIVRSATVALRHAFCSRDHVTSPFKLTPARPMSARQRGDVDKMVKDTLMVVPSATFHGTELCVNWSSLLYYVLVLPCA